MTEYDRGRAAGLAEAVKVAEQMYAKHGSILRTARASNYEHAGKRIAEALRALSTSPGEHVLVPREDLASLLDSFAAESDHDALEASEPYRRLRAMLSAKE